MRSRSPEALTTPPPKPLNPAPDRHRPLLSASPPHARKPRTPACFPPRTLLSPASLVARGRPYATRPMQPTLRELISVASLVSFRRKKVLPGFRDVRRKSRPAQR